MEAGREVNGPWSVIDCTARSPKQDNGYACGVFTILNGYLLSRGVPVTMNTYTQDTLTARSTRRRLMYLLGKAHNARARQARPRLGRGLPRGTAAVVRGGKRTAREAGLIPTTRQVKALRPVTRGGPRQNPAPKKIEPLDALWGQTDPGTKQRPASLATEAQQTLCDYFGTEPKRRRKWG